MKKQRTKRRPPSAIKRKTPSRQTTSQISSQPRVGTQPENQHDLEAMRAVLRQWVQQQSRVEDPGGQFAALRAEANKILRQGPPLAVLHHDDMAVAYSGYLQQTAQRYKNTLRSLGVDVDRRVPFGVGQFLEYDFSPARFEEVEFRYRSNLAYLIRQGAYAMPMPRKPNGPNVPGVPPPFRLPTWLTKLLSLFGIEAEDMLDVGATFVDIVEQGLIDQIEEKMREAVEKTLQGAIGEATKLVYEACELIGRALDRLIDRIDQFMVRLMRRLLSRMDESAAVRKLSGIIGRITSRATPILGWALLLFDLAWLLIKNITDFVF